MAMIWTLIVLWVLLSAAFVGSLAFMASRPMPCFDQGAVSSMPSEPAWHAEESHSNLEATHAVAG